MNTKVLEIRDEMTCIPVMAVQMVAANAVEDRFLWRSGYPRDQRTHPPSVILIKLSSVEAESNPYHWSYARTMREAHKWITEHFTELKDGDVVDVRVILGEATEPAKPEIWTLEKAAEVSS
jgi:hypothetical protein